MERLREPRVLHGRPGIRIPRNLDLIDWPSICWYEIEYSTYVTRQASRRSWRIGQSQPVEVTYFAYEETLQVEALRLVAAKTRSALMVEGELPADGLSALAGDGEDILLDLARRLAGQGASDERSSEASLARRRVIDPDPDALLTPASDDVADPLWDCDAAGDEISLSVHAAADAETLVAPRSADSGRANTPAPTFTLQDVRRHPQQVRRRHRRPECQLHLFDE